MNLKLDNNNEMEPQTKQKGTTNLKQDNNRKNGTTNQTIYNIHPLGNINKTQILPMTKHMVI